MPHVVLGDLVRIERLHDPLSSLATVTHDLGSTPSCAAAHSRVVNVQAFRRKQVFLFEALQVFRGVMMEVSRWRGDAAMAHIREGGVGSCGSRQLRER